MMTEPKAAFSSQPANHKVIYLAGGCFWGMEKLMQALPGVTKTVCGFANGTGSPNPSYQLVCTGMTGYKETVEVSYNAHIITLPQLLLAYFLVIDPTIENQQGHDIGAQYQTGIYYTEAESRKTVEQIVKAKERQYPIFAVEHGPLINFYPAEEYHQNYLTKNPSGYCHIPAHTIDQVVSLIKADVGYKKANPDQIKKNLSAIQYEVTQNRGTEPPHTNEYCDTNNAGIYVDITTGQPLFRAIDKYHSSCGWPSFSAPIYEGVVRYSQDCSFGMIRTEVRSDIGDAHLGHIFTDDPESPNGIRYCINSASLRFVPQKEMEAQGYGAYLILLD